LALGCAAPARPRRGAFGHVAPDEDAYTFYLRGRRAAVEGRPAEAAQWFRRAVAVEPDDVSLRVALAEALLADGQVDAAADQIDTVFARWPNEPDAWIVHGRIRARRGDGAGAAAAYERAMALEPDHERAYLAAAAARQRLGQPERAAAALDALLRRWPDSVDGHYRRGVLALDRRELAVAEQHLARAVALDPDHLDARVRLARTYQAQGRPAKAQALLRDTFDRSGADPWVGEQLFRVLLDVGDRDGALALLADLDGDWRDADVRVSLGGLYLLLRHPGEALAIAEAVLTRQPTHHGARLLAARAAALKRDAERALGFVKDIPAGAPEWPEAQTLAAEQLVRLGKEHEARERLDAALAAAPDSALLIVARARLDESAGDVAAARRRLNSAQAARPLDRDLIFARASLEDRAGQPDLAVQIMQKEVLADEPDSVMALNFIGYSYASRGVKLAEAERLLARALELAPDDSFVLDSWGVLLTRLGRLDEAEAALARADRLAPDEPEVLLHLGEVVLARGDGVRAESLWRRALALDPDAQIKRRIEDRVKALPPGRSPAASGPAPGGTAAGTSSEARPPSPK
jgi:predicted Zn-dependent protease